MDIKEFKTLEDLEEFLRIRNLGYAAQFGMVELDTIANNLFAPFKPNIVGIEDAD